MSIDDVCLRELTVKKLDEQTDLSGFDCSKDDDMGLDEFIHKEAMNYQRESLGITHLFYYKGNIVGYVTVATSSIEVKYTKLHLPFFRPIKYPALLLGRLAVDNRYRRRNIGHCICLWCIGLAKEIAKKIGCRFVIVVTRQSKVEFYRKCGFDICPRFERKEKVFMYFQTF